MVGRLQVTVSKDKDTFADIARRFNVGYTELVRANPGVDPWLPGEGTQIVLPTEFVLPDAPREGLVLNLASMRLYYFPEPKKDGPVEVITHPIGIGKVGWATPEGTTKVVSHVKDPTWTPPVSVRKEHEKEGDILPPTVPPGPDNPLGRHMMRLGWPSYLIHGTNKPPAVGMRASAGCVRLYPEDIALIFEAVPDGTKVTVVNQPVLLGWQGDRLLVQTYEPLDDDKRDWTDVPKSLRQKLKKPKAAAVEEGCRARRVDRLGSHQRGGGEAARNRVLGRSRRERRHHGHDRRGAAGAQCDPGRRDLERRRGPVRRRSAIRKARRRRGHEGKHGELKRGRSPLLRRERYELPVSKGERPLLIHLRAASAEAIDPATTISAPATDSALSPPPRRARAPNAPLPTSR